MKNVHVAFLIVVVAIIAIIPPAITGGAISIDKTVMVDEPTLNVQLNDTNSWTSFFKGLFRAIIAVDEETPQHPDTRDDVVESPIFLPGRDKVPNAKDNLPCEVKLGFCEGNLETAETQGEEERTLCDENEAIYQEEISQCESLWQNAETELAKKKSNANCQGWVTASSRRLSCDGVCAETEQTCASALVMSSEYNARASDVELITCDDASAKGSYLRSCLCCG